MTSITAIQPTRGRVNSSVVMALLDLKGLTQEDVAGHLNVSPPTISRRLNKRTRWTADDIAELSDYLNVPLDVFYLTAEEAFARITSTTPHPDGGPASVSLTDGYETNSNVTVLRFAA